MTTHTLVIPVKYSPISNEPFAKLWVRNSARSTMGERPCALYRPSHRIHRKPRIAARPSRAQIQLPAPDCRNGSMIASVAAASNTMPTGSRSGCLPFGLPCRASGSACHAEAGNQMTAVMMAITAIGTLIRNAERHPQSGHRTAISTPPSTGPIATETPTIAPNIPKARPRCSPWKYCCTRPTVCGLRNPEPKPMKTRAMFSTHSLGANPATSDASPKRLSPRMNSRARPYRSPARPAGTNSTPKAKVYPVSTHCSPVLLAPIDHWIEGRTTLTMETLNNDMNSGTSATPSRDRKSTRLNSSHVANPYAVSCLIPKTQEPDHVALGPPELV